MKPPDPPTKADPVEVDISPGALFLRIVELEREVKGMRRQIAEMEPRVWHAWTQTARIGGGR